MKTVKTVNGIKKIEDWDKGIIRVQLRTILQDHRKALIEKLILGGLEVYIDYKLGEKITHKQLQLLKLKLDELSNSGIDIEVYRPVFEAVLANDFTSLDNAIFYGEIDRLINANLFQSELFHEGRQVFFKDLENE